MRINVKTTLVVLLISLALFAQTGCNRPGANQPGANSSRAEQLPEPDAAMTAEELVEAYRMEPADGAGKSAGRGGKRLGQNVARGRVARGGKEFGKGMGGFGKHTGKGIGRTMRRVFKP